MSESTTDLRLPQELITEILLYLPVKSLLRFKCVSKPWLSLISSPEFIRSHLSRSSKEEGNLNHQQLLFTVRNQDGIRGLKGCSLYSALYEADPSTHVYDIENPNRDTEIVGIINGLVCLAINRNHLFLCNPALRKSKYFPSSNRLNGACVNYCFGYDESTDDYKVVSLLCLRIDVYYHLEVNVYSLRTDSWRRIDDQDLNFFLPVFGDNGMYANGKIYLSVLEHGAWRETIGCLFYEHGAWKKKIVSLDMVSDKFEEVQQPDNYETTGVGHEYDLKLGTLSGGRPSVLCYYHGRKADLWVMDKYGGGEELSWCKVVSIPYDNDNVPFAPPRSHQRVVCILSNGEVVMGNELGLLVYNPKNKEFRNIRLQDDVGSSSKFKAAPLYVVESLVSPGE